MFKVDLEMAEEPEIKLPLSIGSQKNQEKSRKASTSASLTMLKPLCGSQQTGKILQEVGIPDHLICLLRNLYIGQEATVRTGHGTEKEQREIINSSQKKWLGQSRKIK